MISIFISNPDRDVVHVRLIDPMKSDSLFCLEEHPHRRRNPLTGEWVLVSPHRTSRPWQGQTEKLAVISQPRYDPDCYLCPGNSRAGGKTNPAYNSTFVFQNDFSALLADTPPGKISVGMGSSKPPLFEARGERGICRVICFSPRHDLTIARMEAEDLKGVVDVWSDQYQELSDIPWINHVQIFENRGAMMGASNPHPHCQIWATSHLPVEPAKEQKQFEEYKKLSGGCLLCDYLKLESSRSADPPLPATGENPGEQELPGYRMVCENDHFAAVVPFWAVWPFEILLISKRHLGSMAELEGGERGSLGSILKQITTRYDNLFEVSFPYSMGFHQTPPRHEATSGTDWHFHGHFYPPLLRSATVRKFMVGFEMLGTPQRDITPEAAAERLRQVPALHYLA